MNCSKKLTAIALATCVSALVATTASAQNPGFEYGNLFLGFQTTGAGNANYVIANIGDTTTFRDYSSSANQINIANVGAALTAQFGATWFDRTDVYMGAAGAFTNDEFEAPRNGDDPLTIYVATPRFLAQPEGTAGSFALDLGSPSFVQNAANNIVAAQLPFESAAAGSPATIATTGAFTGTFTDYDNQNSFTGVNQNPAYDTFSGGVQAAFGAGSLSFGGINAEAVLDLYRIDPTGASTFEGSLAIDNLGNVSFINLAPIPEPSTALGIGLLVGLVGVMKRRRTVVA